MTPPKIHRLPGAALKAVRRPWLFFSPMVVVPGIAAVIVWGCIHG